MYTKMRRGEIGWWATQCGGQAPAFGDHSQLFSRGPLQM